MPAQESDGSPNGPRGRQKGSKNQNKRWPGVTIWQRPDGNWTIAYRDPTTGKRRERLASALMLTNRRQREAWAIDMSRRIQAARRAGGGRIASRNAASPHDVVTSYLATVAKESTKAPKRVDLELAADWLVENDVAHMLQLDGERLMLLRDHLLARDDAPTTTNRRLVNLGIWLRWARERGLARVDRDQISKAVARVKVPRELPQYFRPLQVQQILEACIAHDEDRLADRGQRAADGNRWAAPFTLALLLTGARFDEVNGLRWSEIEWDDERIVLPADRVKTNTGRAIVFDVSPFLPVLLRALRKVRSDCDGPFAFASNSHWDQIVKRLRKDYGVPREFTAHACRRTHASLMISAPNVYGSASLFRSCKRLGHDASEAERKYACDVPGLNDGRTFEAVAGIEKHAEAIVAAIEKEANGE